MAMPAEELPVPPLTVEESRDFRSYHAFLRAARNYMEGPLVARMRDAYDDALASRGAAPSADWREAEAVLDELVPFQLYCWSYRHLQRFKYHRPSLGIFATLEAQRVKLLAAGVQPVDRQREAQRCVGTGADRRRQVQAA